MLTRKMLDSLTEYVKTYRAKGLAWIVVEEDGLRSQVTKFLSDDVVDAILKKADASVGDALLIVADKNEVVFELTEEGRSLTFCSIMWWEKPMADDETIHTPNLPFDGGGGSGGEGNVQTGPRGSIITEPMVPLK